MPAYLQNLLCHGRLPRPILLNVTPVAGLRAAAAAEESRAIHFAPGSVLVRLKCRRREVLSLLLLLLLRLGL